MLRQHNIDNLLGGVSQQSPGSRFPNQCSEQINASIRPIYGLTKRPPSEHVFALQGMSTGSKAFHTIDRDANEQYLVAAEYNGSSTDLKVYDLAGTGAPVTLNAPSGLTYLQTNDPASDLRFTTFDDFTLVLNKKITTALTSDQLLGYEGRTEGHYVIIWLDAANYDTDFTITIGKSGAGSRRVKITTDDGQTAGLQEINTSTLIDDFENAFELNTTTALTPQATITISTVSGFNPNDWDIQSFKQFLVIHRQNPNEDFWVQVEDSSGGQLLQYAKDKVNVFTNLPNTAAHGMVFEVQGEANSNSYYVKFEADQGYGVDRGVWRETAKVGVSYKIDPATMPHALIRNANGSFDFTPLINVNYGVWGNRAVGDEDSNVEPSFIGNPIDAMCFFQSRLVLCSGESVVMSETNEPFNFWRTTVLDLPDTERIDVQASSDDVNTINWAVPAGARLYVISEHSQFVVQGDAGITPTNVSMTRATEYASHPAAKPVLLGSSVLLPTLGGDSGGLRELIDSSNFKELSFDAPLLSAPVPNYIPGPPGGIAVSEQSGHVVITPLFSSFQGNLYVYNFWENEGSRVQSAWHKWTLGDNGFVSYAQFIGTKLYLVVQRAGSMFLESLETTGIESESPSECENHLDRKVSSLSGQVTVSYDPVADATTWTLPYAPTNNTSWPVHGGSFQAVKRFNFLDARKRAGERIPITSISGNQVVAAGDHRGVAVDFGNLYSMSYKFSPIYMTRDLGFGPRPMTSGRLSLRYVRLLIEGTGALSVERVYRETDFYNETLFDEETTSLFSGTRRIPLFAENTEVDISLYSFSYKPCRLTGSTFESSWRPYTRG